MSAESTLTSKGQTTIPKDIRDRLHIKTGDRMTFTVMPDGAVLLRIKNKSAMSLAGSLRRKGQKALLVEQLASELLFEDEASDSSAQFADCLTGARHWALECRATASFDAKALRLPGFVAV